MKWTFDDRFTDDARAASLEALPVYLASVGRGRVTRTGLATISAPPPDFTSGGDPVAARTPGLCGA